MGKLSRRRCFVIIYIFLIADLFNLNYIPAGKATWYLYPLAALVIMPFYRAAAYLCCRGDGILRGPLAGGVRGAFALLAAALMGGLTGQLAMFITVNNDFFMSPAFVAGLACATGLYVATLRERGFERYVDVTFFWIALTIGFYFVVGLGVFSPGRLLPIYEGEDRLMALGLLKLAVTPFAQGFIAIACLSPQAEEKTLRASACRAAMAAGLTLGFEQFKSICVIGYETASRLTFPAYMVAGVQLLGSYGVHMEELLICGLLLARTIKIGVLIRFAGGCVGNMFKNSRRAKRWASVLTAAGAYIAGLTLMSTSAAVQKWLGAHLIPVAVLCLALPPVLALAAWIKQKKIDI